MLNGNKKTAKLSPAPLLIDVRIKQYKRTNNEEKEASIIADVETIRSLGTLSNDQKIQMMVFIKKSMVMFLLNYQEL